MFDNAFINLSIQAAILAGDAIMKVYTTDFEVSIKSDSTPLTLADSLSNEIIYRHLSQTNIPIISEESKEIDYDVRKNWTSCWMVDPLDGTKEFIKKNGEFTVNIAFIQHQKPVFGIIYIPVERILYLGNTFEMKSYKAFVPTGTTLTFDMFKAEHQLNSTNTNLNCIRIVASKSHITPETEEYITQKSQEYEQVELLSKGSSLKFCLVAEGQADVYPRFAPTMEWDTAAGQAICEAVGLRVTDQVTQQSMLYNRPQLLNNSFLVSAN
ncbi:MAG: 3'(2'),5'-bisphosphate nucleotidase CysQ [Sphingobacteriaceae bacterium]|nr:3'(2'),5'-bisphosphate nucleotidase CysQ [Sphingobacteriaceae bacterium]